MSLKIYDAYRVLKPKDVWPILWEIKAKAENNIRASIRAHYIELVRSMDPDTDEYKKAMATETRPEYAVRLTRARDFVRDQYKKQLTSGYRNPYALDVTVALYPHKSNYYIRLFCDSMSIVGTALDFVADIPGLAEYHYQNSADKPDEVPSREWAKRKKIWNEIFSDSAGIGNHVSMEIHCYDSFWRLDPWLDLARDWHKNPPVIPIREQVWAEDLAKLKAFSKAEIEYRSGFLRVGDVTVERVEGADSTWWESTIRDVTKEHDSLNKAANHVYFEHLPQATREMVQRYLER